MASAISESSHNPFVESLGHTLGAGVPVQIAYTFPVWNQVKCTDCPGARV